MPSMPVVRMLLRLAVLLLGLLAGGAYPAQAASEKPSEKPIVADLSKHLVAITTGFSGTDVLLFGATDGPGDVVLVVRGPSHTEVVRRKAQLGGMIWVNKDSVTFPAAPAFYFVASNRPVEEIMGRPALERHQILAQHLPLEAEGMADAEDGQSFRDALIRLKTTRKLYGYAPGAVNMLANRLFRADLSFPANVPTGQYNVEVYLVRDGEVVSAEITPLIISKVGIGADVFLFAHDQAAVYGILSIIAAVAAGWLASVVFRKK